MAEKRWFRTADLCQRFGVSRYTIARWEAGGKIPKGDRTLGRPRWWAPLIQDADEQRLKAIAPPPTPRPAGRIASGDSDLTSERRW